MKNRNTAQDMQDEPGKAERNRITSTAAAPEAAARTGVRVESKDGGIEILSPLNDYGQAARETARIIGIVTGKTAGLPGYQRITLEDHNHMRAVIASYYHSILTSHIGRERARDAREPEKLYMSTLITPDFIERVLESAGPPAGRRGEYHGVFMKKLLISLMKSTSFFDSLGKPYTFGGANE